MLERIHQLLVAGKSNDDIIEILTKEDQTFTLEPKDILSMIRKCRKKILETEEDIAENRLLNKQRLLRLYQAACCTSDLHLQLSVIKELNKLDSSYPAKAKDVNIETSIEAINALRNL